MFNRIVHDKSDCIIVLYNSYIGVDSIKEFNISESDYILSILNNSELNISEHDETIDLLVHKGFLVPKDVDEKLRRENLIVKNIQSNNLHLVIHTTENCNFRCAYCSLDFSNNNLNEDVQNSIVKFIRKNITSYKTVTIDWFGGEPLLNINSIKNISSQIKKICHMARKPYTASITTNGYLLTPKNIEILLNGNVRKFCITVDGTKSIHDKQRFLVNGNPTFDKIINNLRYFRDHIKVHFDMIIRTNVSLEISQELNEYYMFFNEEFGNDSRFSLFVRLVGNWGGERVKLFKDSLLEKSAYKALFRTMCKIKREINFNMNISDLEPAGSVCSAVYCNKFTIDIYGGVHKCDTPSDNNKIGYIREDGQLFIDEDLHNKWISVYRGYPQNCDNCFFSCSCFMLSCPKDRVVMSSKNCKDLLEGVDELILLANKTKKDGNIYE